MKVTLEPLSKVIGPLAGGQLYRWTPTRGIAFAVDTDINALEAYENFRNEVTPHSFHREGFKHWLDGHDNGPKGNNKTHRWHHGYSERPEYNKFHVFKQYMVAPQGVSQKHPFHIWGFKLSPYTDHPQFSLCVLVDAQYQSTNYLKLDKLKQTLFTHIEQAGKEFSSTVPFGSSPVYWPPSRS